MFVSFSLSLHGLIPPPGGCPVYEESERRELATWKLEVMGCLDQRPRNQEQAPPCDFNIFTE